MPTRFGVVRLALLVALAGGIVGPLSGQTPPPQTGAGASTTQQAYQKPPTGFILGQVVDATTGQPIGGAVVAISGGAPAGSPATPPVINGAPATPEDAALIQSLAQGNTRQITNGSGQFVFHDLRRSQYRLTVSAPGYVPGSYGQRVLNGASRPVDLPEDGHVGDANIKLWRFASVSGHVVDDGGEPVVGALVWALRATTTGARRALNTAGQAQTDDRGFYHFDTLTPGDYVVALPQTTTTVPTSDIDAYMTAIASGGTASSDFIRAMSESGAPFMGLAGGLRVGDQQVQMNSRGGLPAVPSTPSDGKHLSVYATEYYPAGAAAADGSVLSIAAGEKRTGIDLELHPVQTVSVSGTITGPDGPAKMVGIRLVPASDKIDLGTNLDTSTSVTDANGAFTLLGVPAGQYAIKVQRVARSVLPASSMVTVMTTSGAGGISSFGFSTTMDGPAPPPAPPTGPSYFAELPLSVGDHDLDGVTVTLRTGVHVSGKLVFEGSATPPTPDMLQRMSVSLLSLDGRNPVPQAAPRVQADGQFTSLSYPPGRYLVNPGGAAFGTWTIKSITLGGRSLDESPLELQDDDVGGVVVLFSDQTTEVRGSVHAATGSVGDGDVTVFAFPSNYQAWIENGMSARRQKSSSTGKTGSYALSGLVAGEYLIVAVPAEAVTNTRDLKFYDTLARVATRMTVTDGEKKSLDLAVASVR
jgi:hypothetical protein